MRGVFRRKALFVEVLATGCVSVVPQNQRGAQGGSIGVPPVQNRIPPARG